MTCLQVTRSHGHSVSVSKSQQISSRSLPQLRPGRGYLRPGVGIFESPSSESVPLKTHAPPVSGFSNARSYQNLMIWVSEIYQDTQSWHTVTPAPTWISGRSHASTVTVTTRATRRQRRQARPP